jgi:hypothetical protein
MTVGLALRGLDLVGRPAAVVAGIAVAVAAYAGHVAYQRREFGRGVV